MKNIKLFWFILFSIFISTFQVFAWDFPIKPGTEEWKKLKTRQAKVTALQIPEEVLPKLSTFQLV